MRKLCATLLILGLMGAGSVLAAVPQQLNYQGYLTNTGGNALDTTVAMTFKLYTDSTAGSLLWTETRPSVTVAEGLLNVRLGQVTTLGDAVFNNAQVWLGITVGNNSEMTPRSRIVSVGYSYRVGTVDGASGGTITGDVNINGKANMGVGNSNPGLYAFVAGYNDTASGDYSTVGGGQYNTASGFWSTVGGGYFNNATGALATVGGGTTNTASGNYTSVGGGYSNEADTLYGTTGGGYDNAATGYAATLGGGYRNTASGYCAAVGGGRYNRARGDYAVVGGGGGALFADSNSASGLYSTVSGGNENRATATQSTVGGGGANNATGYGATVPGGVYNAAQGRYSFAAGFRAKANYGGSFVWADSTNSDFASTGINQFLIRATGGVGVGLNNPAEQLEVAGDVKADTFRADAGIRFPDGTVQTTAASGNISGWTDDGTRIRLTTGTDSVGIGTTTPTERLEVSGNLRVSGKANIGSGNVNTGTYAFVVGQDGVASGGYAAVAGGRYNRARGDYAVVAGGGGSLLADSNSARGDYSAIGGGAGNSASGRGATIGGGWDNVASDFYATVAGGFTSDATDDYATIGGGYFNHARDYAATVGGGYYNNADSSYATVGGGYSNDATGLYATIPGGSDNDAAGDYAFAAGRRAKANHDGAFVWADQTNSDFASSANNQFNVRASGGVRMCTNSGATLGAQLFADATAWTAFSDSTKKADIRRVDTKTVLEKVVQLPISEWRYKAQPNPAIRHMGPMAQDFWKLFHLGEDSLGISTIDPDGIALAAIQELQKENEQLKKDLSDLRHLVEQMAAKQQDSSSAKAASAGFTPKTHEPTLKEIAQ